MIFCPHSVIGNLLCGVLKARGEAVKSVSLFYFSCFKKEVSFPAHGGRKQLESLARARAFLLETIELTSQNHGRQRLKAINQINLFK
jgi:hypothetical protein